MVKKLISRVGLAAGTAGIIVAGAAAFSAFEAHVINVTAKIENALSVPVDEIDFGTVFAQEKLDKTVNIALSDAFISAVTATGTTYANTVDSYSQGLRKNGTPVLPVRSNPAAALGAPQTTGTPYDPDTTPTNFFSLGFGGEIVVGFDGYIVNNGGPEVKDFEVTGGSSYPDEKVHVFAAQATSGPWTQIAVAAPRDSQFDLGPLPWAKFIKLVDASDKSDPGFEPEADGFDLDAVAAINQTRNGEVKYMIRQKPKCVAPDGSHPQVGETENGTFVCPEGSEMMPLLCPYLSKHEVSPDGTIENNDINPTDRPAGVINGINAFHGLPGPWTMLTTLATEVYGELSKGADDVSDTWNIDLRVPCYKGECAQEWPNFVHENNSQANPSDYSLAQDMKGKVLGCDLWVEVTGIGGSNGGPTPVTE